MPDDNAIKLRGFAVETMTPSTRETYERQWALFVAWCDAVHANALPALPETIDAYLAHGMKHRAWKQGTIDVVRASIRAVHRAHGFELAGLPSHSNMTSYHHTQDNREANSSEGDVMRAERAKDAPTAKNAHAAKEVWDLCINVNNDRDVRKWLALHGCAGYSDFHEIRALPNSATPHWLTRRNQSTYYTEGYRVVFPLWEIDGSFSGFMARRIHGEGPLCLNSEYGYHRQTFLADAAARTCMKWNGMPKNERYIVNVAFLPTDYLRLLSRGTSSVVMSLADAWTKNMIVRFGKNVHFKLHNNDEPKTLAKTRALIESFQSAFQTIKGNGLTMEIVQPDGRKRANADRQPMLKFVPPPDILDEEPPPETTNATKVAAVSQRFVEQKPAPVAKPDVPSLVVELLRESVESHEEKRTRMDKLRYSPKSRFQFTVSVGERLDRYLAAHQVPKSQGRDAWLALNDLLDKVLPP